jgi:hypothetical protein
MPTTSSRKWVVPVLCLILGFAFLAVFWIAGNPRAGLGSMAIMVAYGALLLFGGDTELLRTLRGQAPDERYGMFDLRATAIAGTVTFFVLIGGTMYELAREGDPSPYVLILAVAGVTYLASLYWLHRRS